MLTHLQTFHHLNHLSCCCCSTGKGHSYLVGTLPQRKLPSKFLGEHTECCHTVDRTWTITSTFRWTIRNKLNKLLHSMNSTEYINVYLKTPALYNTVPSFIYPMGMHVHIYGTDLCTTKITMHIYLLPSHALMLWLAVRTTASGSVTHPSQIWKNFSFLT